MHSGYISGENKMNGIRQDEPLQYDQLGYLIEKNAETGVGVGIGSNREAAIDNNNDDNNDEKNNNNPPRTAIEYCRLYGLSELKLGGHIYGRWGHKKGEKAVDIDVCVSFYILYIYI